MNVINPKTELETELLAAVAELVLENRKLRSIVDAMSKKSIGGSPEKPQQSMGQRFFMPTPIVDATKADERHLMSQMSDHFYTLRAGMENLVKQGKS